MAQRKEVIKKKERKNKEEKQNKGERCNTEMRKLKRRKEKYVNKKGKRRMEDKIEGVKQKDKGEKKK